ncbi:hypothetical protein [Dyella silvatica]|uniref:hypothetical protein n=1 Tax=Dyella silvatica TaxID=2992128 RepID=UPI00224D4153|nr:hypothetical protein [Dyella silvatica]
MKAEAVCIPVIASPRAICARAVASGWDSRYGAGGSRFWRFAPSVDRRLQRRQPLPYSARVRGFGLAHLPGADGAIASGGLLLERGEVFAAVDPRP